MALQRKNYNFSPLFSMHNRNPRENSGNPMHQNDPNLKLSRTNLYIKSLPLECDDNYLRTLCEPYGKIVSTKAILDPCSGNKCKGYGFVDFENAENAVIAVRELNKKRIPAQMAKQQEQDPTNLYFSGLPIEMNESNLEEILFTFGTVISTRILRDVNNQISKGVGFARMENSVVCDRIIGHFHEKKFDDCIQKIEEEGNKKLGFMLSDFSNVSEIIICKLADGGTRKRTSVNKFAKNFNNILTWGQDLSNNRGAAAQVSHHHVGQNPGLGLHNAATAAAAAAGLNNGNQFPHNVNSNNHATNNNNLSSNPNNFSNILHTNSNNINIVNNNGLFPASNNIIIDPYSGTMNHLINTNFTNANSNFVSVQNLQNPVFNSVNLANVISSATPILNGQAAIAAIQQQEQQRLFNRQFQHVNQQAAFIQSVYPKGPSFQNKINPIQQNINFSQNLNPTQTPNPMTNISNNSNANNDSSKIVSGQIRVQSQAPDNNGIKNVPVTIAGNEILTATVPQ